MKLIKNISDALAIAVAGVAAILPVVDEPSLLLMTKPWILLLSPQYHIL